MQGSVNPEILAAEKLNGGVLITFGNGKCALYSAALLYTFYSQAKDISELPQLDLE